MRSARWDTMEKKSTRKGSLQKSNNCGGSNWLHATSERHVQNKKARRGERGRKRLGTSVCQPKALRRKEDRGEMCKNNGKQRESFTMCKKLKGAVRQLIDQMLKIMDSKVTGEGHTSLPERMSNSELMLNRMGQYWFLETR